MIDKFLEFIFAHWQLILEFVLLLIVTLVTILRKRVKVFETVTAEICQILPVFINEVERDGDGSKKRKEVLDLVHAYLKERFPDLTNFGSYDKFIIGQIEKILSTPHKKGD